MLIIIHMGSGIFTRMRTPSTQLRVRERVTPYLSLTTINSFIIV